MKSYIPNLTFAGLLLFAGCNSPSTHGRGNFTLGAAQIKLLNGKTTKAEVLEWFGAPNIATKDAKGEVWNYTRQGTSSQIRTSTVGAWLLLGGVESSSSRGQSGSYSFDLLIRFNNDDVVVDYKVLQTAF